MLIFATGRDMLAYNHLGEPMTARTRAILLVIVLVALGARLAAAALLPDQSATLLDSAGYREAGRQLWTTGQMGTTIYIPLYPAVIGFVDPGWGQLIFDTAASTIMVWLIFQLTRLVFQDTARALLAAAGAAVYPHFIFFSVVGLTETLFSTLVVAAFVCWYSGWFVRGAVFAVLAILTRPVLDMVAPLLIFFFAVVIHRVSLLHACKLLAIYVIVYVCVMTPWWVHNYRSYGSFVRLNPGGGIALFSGNNPMNKGSNWDPELDAHLGAFSGITNPIDRDRAIWRAAMDYIRACPGEFAERAGQKFLSFWRPWPYTQSYYGRFFVMASVLSALPVMVFAVFFFFRAQLSDFIRGAPLIVFAVYLTAVHCVVAASIRYRIPVEPMLLVFAAGGIAIGLSKFDRGRRLLAWLDHGAVAASEKTTGIASSKTGT